MRFCRFCSRPSLSEPPPTPSCRLVERNQRTVVHTTKRQTFAFLYDDRNNINEVTIYNHDNPNYNGKIVYEYDAKRNPFYNLDPIHSGYFTSEIDFIYYKCPNNPTKLIQIDSKKDTVVISEFIYKYNEKDFPIESNELYTEYFRGYVDPQPQSINHRLYVYEMK